MISRLLYVSLIALLATLITKQLHIGIDFYHFWVVGAAREKSEQPLGSPYAQAKEHAAAMNAAADRIWLRYLTRSQIQDLERNVEQVPRVLERLVATHGEANLSDLRENSRFLTINMRRRALDLTGTPLLYALCTVLPKHYETAYEAWAWLTFAAFVLGSFLLLLAMGRPWEEMLLCAAALALAMRPLNTDVRVGNVNGLHLLVAAVALAAAVGPLRRARDEKARGRWGALVLSLVAFYLLLKPTFAFAGLALAGHVALVLGRAGFLRALIPAGIAAVLLALIPCFVFGAPMVWFDWLAYIGQDTEKLAYGVEKSNLSTPLHLKLWFPALPLVGWSMVLGIGLVGSLLFVVRKAAGEGWKAKLQNAARAILAEPYAAMSMGLCVTFATSPLVWGHYLTVFAIPIVWYGLWDRELRGTSGAYLHGALFLATALLYLGLVDIVLSVFHIIDSDGTVRSITAFAWIPLWANLLLWLRARLARGEAAPSSASAAVATTA
ncbi:MAG: DUF2029 domain-containing protein [Planctomycetes bacterium]|nr:DUF2029 domain-containing protein [Planctomycetota bacterium]